MKKKAVSISSELHLLQRALDAVGLLLQQWAEVRFEQDEVRCVAPAAHATVVLVRERVRLLDRVVRDAVDPRLILVSENRGAEPLPGDDGDISLAAWSVEKTGMKAQEEADRSARRLRALRERRTKKRARKGMGER